MSDVKINSVQPLRGLNQPAKTAPKEGVKGEAFDNKLEQAIQEMGQLKNQAEAQAAQESQQVSIQDEIRSSNDLFQEMMKAKQNLARIYQNIQKPAKTD